MDNKPLAPVQVALPPVGKGSLASIALSDLRMAEKLAGVEQRIRKLASLLSAAERERQRLMNLLADMRQRASGWGTGSSPASTQLATLDLHFLLDKTETTEEPKSPAKAGVDVVPVVRPAAYSARLQPYVSAMTLAYPAVNATSPARPLQVEMPMIVTNVILASRYEHQQSKNLLPKSSSMPDNKHLLAHFDWASSSLGPRSLWPVSMTAVIAAIMDSEFPICTAWGDEYIQIYNGAYNSIYGEKHPSCFGRSARESWPEIWPFLEPALAQIRSSGAVLRFENTMLALVKHKEPEECWFDFCYSPLKDDTGHVIGAMSVAVEKTLEVVARRRSESLALSLPTTGTAPLSAIAQSLQTALSRNEMDIHMGVLYDADPHSGTASDILWAIRVDASDLRTLRDKLPYGPLPKDDLFQFELPTGIEGDEKQADHGLTLVLRDQLGRPGGWLQLVPNRLVPQDSHLEFARSLAEQVRRMFGVLQSHAIEVGEVRAELNSNEQLYRFLFDNMDDAAFYTITTGDQQELEIIAAVNQKASDLLGYSSNELVGMRREQLFFPDDPSLTEAVRTRNQEKLFLGEMTFRRNDGSPLLVEISSRLIDLPSGPSRSVSLVRDISNRKRKELERIEQARYEAMSLLTGGIAHDFNNLLTVILHSIELIEMMVPKEAGIAPFVENAYKAAQRGAALTNQLLAYSRRQVQQRRTVQINDVVVESRELVESLLGPHVLELDLANELPVCAFDPTQLTTILLNLAANARDAMEGKGRFTLTTRADAEQRWVVLTASDTGSGIAPNILPRIFDPYFTTKPVGQGSGLGLATVRGLMNQAGGEVSVRTSQGLGSSFTLRFPEGAAAFVDNVALVAPEGEALVSIQSRKVLLVDDNELILKQVAQILREEGADVCVAESSREALQVLAQRPDLDLIISDVVMPGGMTGTQLMSQMRQEAPQIARLLMSGYIPEELGHPSLASDDAPLLRKPFTRAQLLEAVRGVLSASPNPGPDGR